MIECPNCGHQNADTRAFCAVCGERLPQPVPAVVAPPAEEVVEASAPVADEQIAETIEVVDSVEAASAAPEGKEVADIEWLLDKSTMPVAPATVAPPAGVQPESSPPSESIPVAPPATPANAFLPAWLQGMEAEPAPQVLPDADWTDALDFSDLPGWALEPEPAAPPVTEPTPPRRAEPQRSPAWSAESGTGLLAGVKGLIPQQPAIRVPSGTTPFPQEAAPATSAANDAAADLFTRIAGGTIAPETAAAPQEKRRGCSLLHGLLLLTVVVPLLLGLLLGPDAVVFGAPTQLPSATAYSTTIEALPAESTVLLAFDYDGSVRDEVEPGAIATLNHLRTLTDGETATPRNVNLIAISLSPQGPALAERAWAASAGEALSWNNLGFLPGGPIALRTFLTQAGTPLDSAALLVVFANETSDVQSWLEQVGTQRPDLPILSAIPASAETTLMPYLASGQLDGLLAGTPGTASYEVSGAGTLGAGWRRIHAITAAVLLTLGAIGFANLQRNLRRAA